MPTETTLNCHTNPRAKKIWLAHVQAWQKSGLSRAEYCRQHNLSVHTLRYWQMKDKRIDATGLTLVPVAKTGILTSKFFQERIPALKVEVGRRFKVEVADEFSSETLIRLITTLEAC